MTAKQWQINYLVNFTCMILFFFPLISKIWPGSVLCCSFTDILKLCLYRKKGKGGLSPKRKAVVRSLCTERSLTSSLLVRELLAYFLPNHLQQGIVAHPSEHCCFLTEKNVRTHARATRLHTHGCAYACTLTHVQTCT